MTRRFRPLMLVACAMTLWALLPAQDSQETIDPAVMQAVRAAVPQDVLGGAYPLHTCAAVFSRLPDGTPSLVAAGYSASGAAVAMLSYRPGAATVLDFISHRQLFFPGDTCDASIENLADPALPASPLSKTVVLSFGGPDWFFLWSGTQLVNITAPDRELRPNRPPTTDMYNTRIVDVDHSGPMQIFGTSGEFDKFPRDDGIAATGTWTLFRFNGTRYAPANVFQHFYEYNGNWQHPLRQRIDMHGTPAASYRLTAVNGTRKGTDRVTGASVVLNGVQILSPADVTEQTERASRTVSLRKKNVIDVTVRGAPDSVLYVMVQKQ